MMRVFRSKRLVVAGIFDLYERFVIAIITDHAGQRDDDSISGAYSSLYAHNPLGLVAGLEYPLYCAGRAVDHQKPMAELANSLSSIQNIQPTDHSEIAPALSFKRLKVNYILADQQNMS